MTHQGDSGSRPMVIVPLAMLDPIISETDRRDRSEIRRGARGRARSVGVMQTPGITAGRVAPGAGFERRRTRDERRESTGERREPETRRNEDSRSRRSIREAIDGEKIPASSLVSHFSDPTASLLVAPSGSGVFWPIVSPRLRSSRSLRLIVIVSTPVEHDIFPDFRADGPGAVRPSRRLGRVIASRFPLAVRGRGERGEQSREGGRA